MSAETVTVMCVRHRRKVRYEPPAFKGAAIVIVHEAPGVADVKCDSERFTVRREYEASREGAHAELMVLRLYEEHRQQVKDSSEEKPR